MSDTCKCSMAKRVIGEGCRICNPTKALEIAEENYKYLEAESAQERHAIAELQERIALLEAAIRKHRDTVWGTGRDGTTIMKDDHSLYAVLQEDKPHE